jgi:chemotaxis response regulator CheB
MEKRHVLLVQMQPLLGEGLQRIFQKVEDVELVCVPCTDLQTIDSCLNEFRPDVVLLAGEKEDDYATLLISKMLKHFEDIPIVWIELESNVLHLYTSHSLTANSAELINAIRENHAVFLERPQDGNLYD